VSLHRRGALSLVATLLGAGCLGVGENDCNAGVTVDADQFDPVADLERRLDEPERTLAADAVENDGTRRTTYAELPVREPTLVDYEGVFYRLTREPEETVEVPSYHIAAEWEEGRSAPDDGETVAFESLPAADRRAIELAVPNKKNGQSPQGFSVEKYPAPYPEDGEDSRLMGNTTWVEWKDRTVRVEVAGEQTGTTERVTYAFAAERVVTDEDGFHRYLAEEYLVDFSDAPEPQLEILRSARDEDAYEECTPASDALSAIQDRLDEEAKLPEPYRNDWYVAFDSERYRLSILEWVV